MLTASGPGGQNHWGDSATNNSASGTHSADAQLKVLLCFISQCVIIFIMSLFYYELYLFHVLICYFNATSFLTFYPLFVHYLK